MKYGIAHTKNGLPPPFDELISWKKNSDGEDETWKSLSLALKANDLYGWRGYICIYPSGDRVK